MSAAHPSTSPDPHDSAHSFARADIPWVLAIGVPVGLVVALIAAPLLGPDRWLRVMMGERGVIELATVLVLIITAMCGILILRLHRHLPRPVPTLMFLATIGAVYFLGEEASWGQHLLGFETPETVRELNEQNEFNLHNMAWGEWFDNVPRQALYVGTIVFGVFLPFVRRRRRATPEARQRMWYWIIPTVRLVPTAVMVAMTSVPSALLGHRLGDGSYVAMALVDSGGEFKELALATFLMLGSWSVLRRVRMVAACQSHPTVPGATTPAQTPTSDPLSPSTPPSPRRSPRS